MNRINRIVKYAAMCLIIIFAVATVAAAGCSLFNKQPQEKETLACDVPFGAEYCVSDLFTEAEVAPSGELHLVYAEGEKFETYAEEGKVFVIANSEGTGVFSLYSGEKYIRKVRLTCVKESFYLKDDQAKANAALGSLKLGVKTTVPFNVFPSDFGDLVIEADSEYFEITQDNALIPVGVGQSSIRVRALREEQFTTFYTNVTFNSSKAEFGALSVESFARNRLGKEDAAPITSSEFKTIKQLYGIDETQLLSVEWKCGEDLYPMTSLETVYINAQGSKTPLMFDCARYSNLNKLTITAATLPSAAIANAEYLTSLTLDGVALTGSLSVTDCPALTYVTMNLSDGGNTVGSVTFSEIAPQVLSIEMPQGYDLSVANLSLTARNAEDEEDGADGSLSTFNVVMNGGKIALSQVDLCGGAKVSVGGTASSGEYDGVTDYQGLWGCEFGALRLVNMSPESFSVKADELYLNAVKSVDGNLAVTGEIGYAEITNDCDVTNLTLNSARLKRVYFKNGIKLSYLNLSQNANLTEVDLSGIKHITEINVSSTALLGLDFVDGIEGLKVIHARDAESIYSSAGTQTLVEKLRANGVTVYLADNEGDINWGEYTYESIASAAADLKFHTTVEKVVIKISSVNTEPTGIVVPKNVKELTLKIISGLQFSDLHFVFEDTEMPVTFNIESAGCVFAINSLAAGVIDALRPVNLNIFGNVTMNARDGADGSAGKNNNTSVNTANSTGEAGGAGGNGEHALSSAINAEGINITVSSLGATRGNFTVKGGNGGNGGKGGNGQDSNAPDHATGGKGGNGGNGGSATSAIYSKGNLSITVNENCTVKLTGGKGGNGGLGGKGGDGIDENQRDHGGAGGVGGKGGNAASAVICNNFTLYGSGYAEISGANGGNGGNGGKGGAAYKGGIFQGTGNKGRGGVGGDCGVGSLALNVTGTSSIAEGNYKIEHGGSGTAGWHGEDGDGNGNNAVGS